MRKMICIAALLLVSHLNFAKTTQVVEAETCESLHERLDHEQYKFHDTLSQMMTDLREASTPDIKLDQKKINGYMKILESRKNAMKTITKKKLYSTCFL